ADAVQGGCSRPALTERAPKGRNAETEPGGDRNQRVAGALCAGLGGLGERGACNDERGEAAEQGEQALSETNHRATSFFLAHPKALRKYVSEGMGGIRGELARRQARPEGSPR